MYTDALQSERALLQHIVVVEYRLAEPIHLVHKTGELLVAAVLQVNLHAFISLQNALCVTEESRKDRAPVDRRASQYVSHCLPTAHWR